MKAMSVTRRKGSKESPYTYREDDERSATRERLQAAKDKKRKESVRAKRDAREKRKRKAEGKMAPRKAARGTIVGAA